MDARIQCGGHLSSGGLGVCQLLPQSGIPFQRLCQLNILGLSHRLCCRSVAVKILLQSHSSLSM